MGNYQLRPYQQEVVDIINNMDEGSGLVSLFTGAGKTVCFSNIERKGRVLLLSHREELVRQPQKYYDCSFGIEQGENKSNGEEVVSASVMSMVHRLDKFKPDDFDTIITDEAHHAVAPSYQKIYDYFDPRLHIGFTATPNRADEVGLENVYDRIIYDKNIKWGIENGYLSNIICKRVNVGYDISQVKVQGQYVKDFNASELSTAMDLPSINQAIAEIYRDVAEGQTLIFVSSVSQAENVSKEINDLLGKDISCAITGTTPNRDELLQKFRNEEIKCIVNCMILTEGTDLPMVKTIIMARPTKNSSLYTQCVGRGTRLYPNKEYMLLIDCIGNDDIDICTAPSLIGVNDYNVPKDKKTKVEGDLLSIKDTIDSLTKNPASWILEHDRIDLFAKSHNVSMFGVNYVMNSDGSFTCSFGDGIIRVSAPDKLGRCSSYCIPNKKLNRPEQLFVISRNEHMQDTFRMTREYLQNEFNQSNNLWDVNKASKWNTGRVTDKQISFIESLKKCNPEFRDYEIDYSDMTKKQAAVIINKLKFENSKLRYGGKKWVGQK